MKVGSFALSANPMSRAPESIQLLPLETHVVICEVFLLSALACQELAARTVTSMLRFSPVTGKLANEQPCKGSVGLG